MICHNVEQGSDQWLMLRAGLPTASEFEKIVTPAGKLSKQSRDYKARLIAERILRRPLVTKTSAAMIRGTEYEAQAVEFYSGVREIETQRIGFVTNDTLTIGASPDRWAGSDGQVEIKVPECHTHMAYWLAQMDVEKCASELEKVRKACADKDEDSPLHELAELKRKALEEAAKQSIEQEYRVQTQGQLWITERRWSDLFSYNPEGLPVVLVHLKPDRKFIDILAQSVSEFSRDLEAESAELKRRGVIPEE